MNTSILFRKRVRPAPGILVLGMASFAVLAGVGAVWLTRGAGAESPVAASRAAIVSVERSTEEEVSLLVRLTGEPALVRTGGAIAVHFAGGTPATGPGRPDVDDIVCEIGLGGNGAIAVDAVPMDETLVPLDVEIARIPFTRTGNGEVVPETGDGQASPADDAETLLPLASLGGAGEFRGLRVCGIVVRPVRYDPARRALRVSHLVRVTLRVAGAGGARRSEGLRGGLPALGAARRGLGEDDPFLQASVLNWDTARAWRGGPVSSRATRPLGSAEYFDASPNWLKIEITATGLYEIRYQDLAAAGVVPEQIQPGTLRLFNGGGLVVPESLQVPRDTWMDECAILVDADSAGVFAAGNRIRFYALGPAGYRAEYDPALPWTYFEHPYSTRNVYWLTWQEAGNPPSGFAAAPRRITGRVTADSLGAPATRDSTFTEHLHYEQNEIENFRSPVADGWYWSSFSLLGTTKRFTAVHPDAVPAAPARVRVSLVGWAEPEDTGVHYHSARAAVDDPDLAERVLGWRQWNDENEAVIDSTGSWLATEPETSFIWVSVAAGDSCAYLPTFPDTTCNGYFDRNIYLNSIDLFYARRLHARANELRFAAPEGAAGPIELVIPGFTDVTGLTVWDITDPTRVQSLDRRAVTGSSGQFTLTVRDTIGAPGTLRRYLATNAAHLRHPAAIELHTLPADLDGAELLRRRTAPVDYVIVSDTRFLAAAERLAAHRSGSHATAVVTTESVMDEFGWGLMDPTALRDFARYAYHHWNGVPGDTTVHALQYLVLLGDTNKDFLNRSGSSEPIYVPSYEGRYLLPRSGYETDYAADDWYAYTVPNDSIPDFAVGRLPVKSVAEADRVVNRIIAYENTPEWGDWRTRVILAADDLHRPSAQYDVHGEAIHTVDTETLANFRFPPAAELVKVYETEYPLRGGKKPDASAALRQAFDDGALFINYIGHGDATRLADENLLEWNGSWDPSNGNRRPVMVILSCSVGVFDAPGDGLAEILLDQPNGGLIGAFSSSFLAFSDDNRNLANAFYTRVFETHPPRTLGMAARLAKNDVIVHQTMLRALRMERYAVLADPALELAWPDYDARFGPATSDSLVRRAKAFVEGTVYDGPDSTASPLSSFTGEATLLVRATSDTSGYDFVYEPFAGSELQPGHVDYTIPGPPLFWGQLSVVNGRFGKDVVTGEGEFFVPADAAAGNHGRIGVYMSDPVQGLDATGSLLDLRVSPQIAVGDSLAADSIGPVITLFEPGGTPVGAARPILVRSLMTVVVSDPHGVNASGSDPFFALAYRVDDGDWIDLTHAFRVDAGGFTTGRTQFELAASVGPGLHTLHVRAADNLNNRSEAAFELVVTAADAVNLGYVFAYPSPFTDRTVIIYDLAGEADVEVRIYTTAGRMVRRLREGGQPGQNRTLVWDGRDEAGDPVANGVYFVKLNARELEAGGTSHHATTRLARIR